MIDRRGERGNALIDGLILLVVLTAVPLALLFCCGGKVRTVTNWGVRLAARICRRPAAKAPVACGAEQRVAKPGTPAKTSAPAKVAAPAKAAAPAKTVEPAKEVAPAKTAAPAKAAAPANAVEPAKEVAPAKAAVSGK